MIGDPPTPFDGRCLVCGEREALEDAFLCAACCPVPEPAPEPEVWQPGLFEVLAA